jgi:hypothetical protein
MGWGCLQGVCAGVDAEVAYEVGGLRGAQACARAPVRAELLERDV